MNNLINIAGRNIEQIIYKNEPVLTYKMIDELHQRPDDTTKKAFKRHKQRFIENEDYFDLKQDEIEIIKGGHDMPPLDSRINELKLFTQSGYLLLIKIFNDDKSWEIQKALIKCYFIVKDHANQSNQFFNIKDLDSKYSILKKQRQLIQEHEKLLNMVQSIVKGILNGTKSIHDYDSMPELQEKIKEKLETYKQDEPENAIIYRLDMLVNDYLTTDFVSRNCSHIDWMNYIKVNRIANDNDQTQEISFIASSRDLFQAFNWLNKKYSVKNPFKNTRVLGSKLSQIDWFHTNWKFERNIKIILGDRKHLFTKSLSNNLEVIS